MRCLWDKFIMYLYRSSPPIHCYRSMLFSFTLTSFTFCYGIIAPFEIVTITFFVKKKKKSFSLVECFFFYFLMPCCILNCRIVFSHRRKQFQINKRRIQGIYGAPSSSSSQPDNREFFFFFKSLTETLILDCFCKSKRKLIL